MIPELQQDQAALYALGLLDAEEAVAFEKELQGNAELRALVLDLQDGVASLAYAAPSREVPAGLRDRVLRNIALTRQGHAREPGRRGAAWPWAIAAVLALFCGLLFLERQRLKNDLAASEQTLQATTDKLQTAGQKLQTTVQELETTRGALQISNRKLEDTRRDLIVSNQKVEETQARDPLTSARLVVFAPSPEGPREARASVAWQPDRQVGLIRIANLPAPKPGRDYQLWAVDANHPAPVSAGIVRVNAKGEAEVRFKPTDETRAVKAFAISIEREGGSTKKEGPIILVGTS